MGYEFTVYITTESDEILQVCAVVMNVPSGSPAPFTLSATTEDGEAGNKNCPIVIISETNTFFHAESDVDYSGFEDVPLIFEVGDHRVCHSIHVLNDSLCELSPTEYFISLLEYESGEIMVIISPDQTRIIINDTSDCGKLYQ